MPALRARQRGQGSASLNLVTLTARALQARPPVRRRRLRALRASVSCGRVPWLLAGVLAVTALGTIARPTASAAAAPDRFVAGAGVVERTPVDGDLFAAGGSVDIEAPVAGDAIVAGGTVRLDSPVRGSTYAAAGSLSIAGPIERNARLAGGHVRVEPSARIGGNLTVAAGRAELRGAVDGSFVAAAGSVLIDARIGGDADVTAGSVSLGPHARIDGSLRYRSHEPLQRDPSAQVAESVERPRAAFAREDVRRSMRGLGTVLWVLWTIGLTLLAAIVVALVPRAAATIAASLRQRPGLALAVGFVVLVCTPIAVVLSLVTVIGIPLGLTLLLVYLMLLPLAWVAAAIGIADWFVSLLPSVSAGTVTRRVVATALSVVLLALASSAPWVGGWIAAVALMAGLGALALQLRALRAG